MAVEQNQVLFGGGGAWLSARRIDGQFPNYRQLRPDAFEHEVVLVQATSCSTCVARAELLATRNAPVRLVVRARRGDVSAADAGRRRDARGDAVEFHGDALEIGFNPEFLRDGVDSVRGRHGAAEADHARCVPGS